MPSKNNASVPSTKAASTAAKPPIHTLRMGRIKAAIWENEADQKKFYNVTFARNYVDEAKKFHDTDSIGRDDLPLVSKLADQAHSYIFARRSQASE